MPVSVESDGTEISWVEHDLAEQRPTRTTRSAKATFGGGGEGAEGPYFLFSWFLREEKGTTDRLWEFVSRAAAGAVGRAVSGISRRGLREQKTQLERAACVRNAMKPAPPPPCQWRAGVSRVLESKLTLRVEKVEYELKGGGEKGLERRQRRRQSNAGRG